CSAAPLQHARHRHREGRDLARPRTSRRVDRRPVEVRTCGDILRVRVSHWLRDGGVASQSRIRRAVHGRRLLCLEGIEGADATVVRNRSMRAAGAFRFVAIPLAGIGGQSVSAQSATSIVNCGAAWSPTGEAIAFHSNRDGHWSVYVMDTSGHNVRRVFSDTVATREPAWSPDGGQLVVARGPSGNRQIVVVDRDGRNPRLVTTNAGTAEWPSWSHDGTSIVYDWDHAGNRDVYRVSVHGGPPQRLTSDSSVDNLPKWGSAD